MRTIKFRAWDLNEDEYIPWEHLIQVRYNQDFYKTKDQRAPILSALTDKYIILEQFTGLHDSKGVEIFEGDVSRRCVGYFVYMKYSEINARFMWTRNAGYGAEFVYPIEDHDEVIGTIHDAEYKELAK